MAVFSNEKAHLTHYGVTLRPEVSKLCLATKRSRINSFARSAAVWVFPKSVERQMPSFSCSFSPPRRWAGSAGQNAAPAEASEKGNWGRTLMKATEDPRG
jgi:hypothetical protein